MRWASVGAGCQERPRDLFGCQAAHLAQRERDLRIGGKRGMAARENQSQPIVSDALFVSPCGRIDNPEIGVLAVLVQRIETLAPPDGIDGLEPSGGDEPRARVVRHAVARPLLQRRPEGVVQRLLGDVEVAQQANQRREHAPRVGGVNGIHRLSYVIGRFHVERSQHLGVPTCKWR